MLGGTSGLLVSRKAQLLEQWSWKPYNAGTLKQTWFQFSTPVVQGMILVQFRSISSIKNWKFIDDWSIIWHVFFISCSGSLQYIGAPRSTGGNMFLDILDMGSLEQTEHSEHQPWHDLCLTVQMHVDLSVWKKFPKVSDKRNSKYFCYWFIRKKFPNSGIVWNGRENVEIMRLIGFVWLILKLKSKLQNNPPAIVQKVFVISPSTSFPYCACSCIAAVLCAETRNKYV